jgi:M3 family oligoendopeptidase
MKLTFSEFSYHRPDLLTVQTEFKKLTTGFVRATSAAAQDEALKEINVIRQEFESMASLARIRHTLDTIDTFYKDEQDFFDEAEPHYQELITDYYRALVDSPFRQELSNLWGNQLFTIAEMTLKTFSSAVIEDLQQENRLASRYKQLLASASIFFEGEERNLAQLAPFQESADRRVRKAAYEARYQFFADHLDQFDEIFDGLVKQRTTIARKLGFSSFTELGYLRMNRSDYNADMVAVFRSQIEQYVVPLSQHLREKQRRRLGLEHLLYYDEKVFYVDGNAVPLGTPEEIVAAGATMYEELSEETGRFFAEMTERGLLDLLSRKGKGAGGYCDYLSKFKAPFIFANFNGTSGDVDVLTHEAGHAFQVWLCRDRTIPEYNFATMEAAEIPSMGMELLAWPWMERFFGDKADKYRYFHLSESLLFLPYGTLVDAFQHEIYENPTLSPQERRQVWRALERTYLPHRDYADHTFLDEGGYWFQQGHIFEAPFYYIDYVLAQSCVFQLWQQAGINRTTAWTQYMNLCKAGGSLPFTKLLEKAELVSPFTDKTISGTVDAVKDWLENIDENRL